MSDAQVDAWILSKTAFISRAQAAQTAVNTPIITSSESVEAIRPSQYGRALVYRTGDGGLIDAKGAGKSRNPLAGGHSDGLATLGEATREFLYEKLLKTVFTHAGSAYETVEHYGVVDLGFDVVHADGTTSPAGLILRQAHERVPNDCASLDDAPAREIELTLRRYGLTSAGAYRADHAFEKINLQGTPSNGILDFGGFLSVEGFSLPARNFDSPLDMILPGQIDFVQPVARIRVPFASWGYGVTGIADPKLDNPWIWSHELARDYRVGAANRHAFKTHFESLVGTYRRALLFAGGEANSTMMEALVRGMHEIH